MSRKLATLIAVLAAALMVPSSARSQNAVIDLWVFDESVLPPASMTGAQAIPGTPVALYGYDGAMVAQGFTDTGGRVTLTAPAGAYMLRYGGLGVEPGAAIGTAFSILPMWMEGGAHDYPVAGPWIGSYSFWQGMPLLFESMDLDPATPGPQRSVTVRPGDLVTAELVWEELPTINVPIWYVSLFGSWQPTAALADVKTGTAGPMVRRRHTETVTFPAPTAPGVHSVRLVQVLDFDWPVSFYTARHYSTTLGRDMGISIVGRGNFADYAEGRVTVEARKALALR